MIGKVVKNKRDFLGITQETLSKLMQCNRTQITMIENETRLPTREQFNKLISILQIDEKLLRTEIRIDIDYCVKDTYDNYNLLKILNIVKTV